MYGILSYKKKFFNDSQHKDIRYYHHRNLAPKNEELRLQMVVTQVMQIFSKDTYTCLESLVSAGDSSETLNPMSPQTKQTA